MVGSPRRLKASLEPSRQGPECSHSKAGRAVQREEEQGRASPPIVHHRRVVIGHQHVAALRFDEVDFKA